MVELASAFLMRASPSVDARGASRSPSDGMRAKSVRCASRDSRTIHRIGRDAGNCVAQTERGAFRSSSLGDKLHPCQSIASRLAIARGICARFPASGGRLAPLCGFASADGDGGLPKTIQIIAQKSGATQRAAPAPYTKTASGFGIIHENFERWIEAHVQDCI